MIATTSCRTAISAQQLPPRMWRWSARCVSNLHDKMASYLRSSSSNSLWPVSSTIAVTFPLGNCFASRITCIQLLVWQKKNHQVGLCNPEKQHGKEHWVGSPCDQGGEWHCLCWQHVWFHLAFPPGKLTIAAPHNDSGHSWKTSPSCCPNPGHIEQFETKIGRQGIDLCEGQIPLVKSSLSSDCS